MVQDYEHLLAIPGKTHWDGAARIGWPEAALSGLLRRAAEVRGTPFPVYRIKNDKSGRLWNSVVVSSVFVTRGTQYDPDLLGVPDHGSGDGRPNPTVRE